MIEIIGKMIGQERKIEFLESKQISLGKLIEIIEKLLGSNKVDGDSSVYFDFADYSPTGLSSWRGIYSELAITYGYKEVAVVIDFLTQLKQSIDKVFNGWKGGDFKMNKDTPIWVANPGRCHNTGVIGACASEYRGLIIETQYTKC